jgi:hypothetical protein
LSLFVKAVIRRQLRRLFIQDASARKAASQSPRLKLMMWLQPSSDICGMPWQPV